jgi:electron transport complex protein RnfG
MSARDEVGRPGAPGVRGDAGSPGGAGNFADVANPGSAGNPHGSGEQGNPGVAAMEEPQPSSFRLIFTLGLAGLLSGLAIVGIYELTLPRITANQARELREAVFEVVPGSKQIQPLIWHDGQWSVPAEGESEEGAIYGAYDDEGRFLGYAIPAEGPGFQDTIKLIYGFDPVKRQIVGMRVLESRETPGLGDKIVKDRNFAENFRALGVDPNIKLVKNGAKSAPNEVNAITGATISSRSVVKILNAGDETWLSRLPAPGNEPALVRGEK